MPDVCANRRGWAHPVSHCPERKSQPIYGHGKAPQAHTGEDDKDIHVTIRQITEGRD
jgi:hypothetical protein